MQELTDADRQAINHCIAKRLGWTNLRVVYGCGGLYEYWYGRAPYDGEEHELPDYFSDAKAADRIKQWLVKNGFQYETSGSPIKGVDYYASIRTGGTCDYIVGIHSGMSEYEALALAVVEKGKFCPECKTQLIEGREGAGTEIQGHICPKCKMGIETDDALNWRARKELEEKADDKGS